MTRAGSCPKATPLREKVILSHICNRGTFRDRMLKSQQFQAQPGTSSACKQQATGDTAKCRQCRVLSRPNGQSLYRCTGCQQAFYCCTEHQKLDWKSHKVECKSLARKQQAEPKSLSPKGSDTFEETSQQFQAEVDAYVRKWEQRKLERQPDSDDETPPTVEDERSAVRDLLTAHPCPPEEKVRVWMRRGGGGLLARVYADCGIKKGEEDKFFRYDVLQKMWAVLTYKEEVDEVRSSRLLGLVLYAHGQNVVESHDFGNFSSGNKCMQLHYYILNFLICGGDFYPHPGKFFGHSVFGYKTSAVSLCHQRIASHWNRIGDWLN